jgi:hypothetical protein
MIHAIVVSLFTLSKDHGFIHWLETHLLSCPFKQLTGADCPGCGFQRSVVALLRGDIASSLKLYPATIPFVGLMIFLLLHLKFDFKNGAFIIKLMYILITTIIIINYIYKVYHQQLF